MRSLWTLSLVLTLFGSLSSWSQEGSDDLSPPPTQFEMIQKGGAGSPIAVGDLLGFEVPTATENSVIEIPESQSLFDQGWILKSAQENHVVLVPLKAGELLTPSLRVVDAEGNVLGVTAREKVSVISALVPEDYQTKENEKLKPPLGLDLPLWVKLLGGIIGLSILALFVRLIVQVIQKSGKGAALPQSLLSEHEQAYRDFEALKKKGYISLGLFKTYYFEASEILKSYLSRRYEFDALESTSGEILQKLEERKLVSDRLLDELQVLLERMDRVKFTDFEPHPDESDGLLKDLRNWIRGTQRKIIASSGLTPESLKKEMPSNAV